MSKEATRDFWEFWITQECFELVLFCSAEIHNLLQLIMPQNHLHVYRQTPQTSASYDASTTLVCLAVNIELDHEQRSAAANEQPWKTG